jgi:hypothetical protein
MALDIMFGCMDLKISILFFCKYKELLDPIEFISFVNKDKNVCGVKYPLGVGLFRYPFVAYWTIDDARLGYSN